MSGRILVPRTRCSGQWTEARYRSFIKSNLRQATRKWAPIQECKKRAWIRRGWYVCEECHCETPTTIKTSDGKRKAGGAVDHTLPIIDPATGFVSWDETIERMFCELDNLKYLCNDCHDIKTKEETAIAVARRREEKHGS